MARPGACREQEPAEEARWATGPGLRGLRVRGAGRAAPPEDGDEQLRAALRELPVRMRTAVVLRYFEDLSEQQTASLMGCSPSAVNTQTARGLARLRTALTVLQPAGGDER